MQAILISDDDISRLPLQNILELMPPQSSFTFKDNDICNNQMSIFSPMSLNKTNSEKNSSSTVLSVTGEDQDGGQDAGNIDFG